jgi:hypothetical protein
MYESAASVKRDFELGGMFFGVLKQSVGTPTKAICTGSAVLREKGKVE